LEASKHNSRGERECAVLTAVSLPSMALHLCAEHRLVRGRCPGAVQPDCVLVLPY